MFVTKALKQEGDEPHIAPVTAFSKFQHSAFSIPTPDLIIFFKILLEVCFIKGAYCRVLINPRA